MIQFFHWYIAADGNHWNHAAENANQLASLGINAMWLPPATKGKEGENTNGYDVYDVFDLGEFDQKNSVRTKFGTKDQYINAIKTLKENGINVYADIVLNHKAGGDEIERIKVRRVDPEDRTKFISEPFEIDGYTKFTFPGRQGKYSAFIWDHKCFSGLDYASDLNESSIFCILNEYDNVWEDVVNNEKGNYDYLMFNDIEFRNPDVREELKKWGQWYLKTTSVGGVRLDAVKHMSPQFYNEWLDHLRTIKPDLFAVGEYWAPGELPLMLDYIEATNSRMCLFDAALHHNFHNASNEKNEYDLSKIFENTLVSVRPDLAVTVVDNHDTQPLQALEAPVEAWFKPLAYALILLREAGYPCIFYPDLYGGHYKDKDKEGNEQEIFLDKCENIEKLLQARKEYAYGDQTDYFDHPNCVGWTRKGVAENQDFCCAVILSNGDEGFKNMDIGIHHKGKTFVDLLGKHSGEVIINDDGFGNFLVPAGSASVWVLKK